MSHQAASREAQIGVALVQQRIDLTKRVIEQHHLLARARDALSCAICHCRDIPDSLGCMLLADIDRALARPIERVDG